MIPVICIMHEFLWQKWCPKILRKSGIPLQLSSVQPWLKWKVNPSYTDRFSTLLFLTNETPCVCEFTNWHRLLFLKRSLFTQLAIIISKDRKYTHSKQVFSLIAIANDAVLSKRNIVLFYQYCVKMLRFSQMRRKINL